MNSSLKLGLSLLCLTLFSIAAFRVSGALLAVIGRFVLLPATLLLLVGTLYAARLWFEESPKVFDDTRTGVTERTFTTPDTCSVTAPCAVCDATSGGGTSRAAVTEFTVAGRPFIQFSRTDETFCGSCFDELYGQPVDPLDRELDQLLTETQD